MRSKGRWRVVEMVSNDRNLDIDLEACDTEEEAQLKVNDLLKEGRNVEVQFIVKSSEYDFPKSRY